MNKQKLQENIEKVEVQLAATQSELERMKKELAKPMGQWVPEHAADYWAIGQDGKIRQHTSWEDAYTHRQAEIGNCHKTKELATAALDRQKLKVKILNSIAELNDGWEPDWNDEYQNKYHLKIIFEHRDTPYYTIRDLAAAQSQAVSSNLYLKSEAECQMLKYLYTPEQLTAAYWP